MRDNFARYEQVGAAIYGVNPASVAAHDSYVADFGFPFRLVSDAGRKIAAAYGALKENGTSIQRSVFVVSGGVVCFARVGAPSSDDILSALAQVGG
ncbi:MAG: redoxin domain-containing protein [Candidatus Sericytochromatia bacterium]|nr:redoxin domain-containing protein [Candidatus Tanganyikabacteria bacterium]